VLNSSSWRLLLVCGVRERFGGVLEMRRIHQTFDRDVAVCVESSSGSG